MEDREQLKIKMLEYAFKHVPFEGWSVSLLEKAAKDCERDPSYGWRLFPNGPRDAISLWSHLLDKKMLETLPATDTLKIRERITLGVKTRISLLIPYREATRETTRYLKKPFHIPDAMRLLYQTVSDIWYYAGDTSTDYNFYTKRALLSWVYSTTFLYWLKDDSEGFEKTWIFLDKRIAEVLSLPKYFKFPWKHPG